MSLDWKLIWSRLDVWIKVRRKTHGGYIDTLMTHELKKFLQQLVESELKKSKDNEFLDERMGL